jgi:drug/metabolite transporter (DMT)-like permease
VLLATVLALGSAVLHAAWNLIIKRSDDRELAAWGQFIAGALLFLPVLVVAGLPDRDSWVFLATSGVVHLGYIYALVSAYHHGDFSLAYPLARGSGALIAAVVGAIAIGDSLHAGEWVALVVVAVGLASLVRPGAPGAEIGYALLTGAFIGTYTVIDTAGARRTDNGFVYTCALMIVASLTLSIAATARGRAHDFARSVPTMWRQYLYSGLFLTTAYGLVLVAARLAPVGYVATLRESSVVLGAVFGWLLLGEEFGRRRFVSSIVVAAGLVALIAFR